MRKVVKLFYLVGILFWSSILFHSLFLFIAYNGFGDWYKYKVPLNIDLDFQRDSSMVYISYVYDINGNQFQNQFETSANYFDSFGINTIIVEYNQKYPSLSVVKGLPNMLRKERIIITISIIFISLQTLFYKLAIRKSNLKKYGMD